MGLSDDDRFAQEWRGFVVSIATKLRAQLDLRADLDELIALGYAGLFEARRRYRPSSAACNRASLVMVIADRA